MPSGREVILQIDGATVIKTPKRKRTVGWRWVEGQLILRVPARTTRGEIDQFIALARQRAHTGPKRRPAISDKALQQEADRLNAEHFDGALSYASIRYAKMISRRGSCTPATGEIRISSRLANVPAWVRLAVVHHELCHLLEAGHGAAFRALLMRYPLMSEAEDYLRLLELGPAGLSVTISTEERAALLPLLEGQQALADLRERLSGGVPCD